MRIRFTIAFACMLAAAAVQAQFEGGPGDGFATAGIEGIDPAVGMEGPPERSFAVYPNPVVAGTAVTLRGSGEAVLWSPVRCVARIEWTGGETVWRVPVIPSGVYILRSGGVTFPLVVMAWP